MENNVLPARESKFENIVRQAPVGITILRSKEMIVEMANETYLQIVDRREEEFVGRSLYDSLPEVREFVAPLLDKVYETGEPYHGLEFPVTLNRYGQSDLTYFNFVYQALRDEAGMITGIIVIANEVTGLVNTKKSIAESERQFRNFVMQSPIAMTIFRGPEFIIEMANKTLMETIWYKTAEEVMGKSVLEVFPELKHQKYPELLNHVLATGQPHRENESFAIVGELGYYLDFEYAVLKDADGNNTGIMVTVNDVTEKVLARQTVEDTKERLRLAVEATGLANWDLDLVTREVHHSPRLAEIFGHAPDTLLTHQQMYDQLAPGDLEEVVAKALTRAKETCIYQYEARVIHPDGNTIWVKTQGKVIYDDTHTPVKMIGTMRDITEEKAFSQELERQVQERTKELALKNEALEKMNAELKSFAYVSSHDLQEPLRKIQIFSERIAELESDKLSAKGKDYFDRIEKAAATMQTLIKDLLAYSRASNTELIFEKASIHDLLQDVINELREEIEEKGALIHHNNLGVADVIPFQFRQLLTNLISNSLKFSKEDKTSVISIKHEIITAAALPQVRIQDNATYHHLSIADNGIGFGNEFRDKIFDIFQRLNEKAKFKGTGIGLAIVKKIVENHGGIIEAHGQIDEGARFDIYIPVR